MKPPKLISSKRLSPFLLMNKNVQHSKFIAILSILACLCYCCCLVDARSKLDNYRSLLCVNLECTEPISDGVTVATFPPPEKIFLPFKENSIVKIFGKTGDNNFYYAELNKKFGFVPSKLIKETNVHFEGTKLKDVNFDFKGFEKTLSPNSAFNNNKNNNETIVSLSSSDHPPPDDKQSNTATPFVYSHKVTVIDGTTIDEDLLRTATPSPTFVQKPVSKTATIEANFTDVVELDKETVGQKESELVKEHGSLFKQLVKPIVPVAVDNHQNDVTVESEDSKEQDENVTDVGEKIDVTVVVDSKPVSTSNVEQKNLEANSDVSSTNDTISKPNISVVNVENDQPKENTTSQKEIIENINNTAIPKVELSSQNDEEKSVQEVFEEEHPNGEDDDDVNNVDANDHAEESALLNKVEASESNKVVADFPAKIDPNQTGDVSKIDDQNQKDAEIAKNIPDSSTNHQQVDKNLVVEDQNANQQPKAFTVHAASVAEPILDNSFYDNNPKIIKESAQQQQPQLQQPETTIHSHVIADADSTSVQNEESSFSNVPQQQQQQNPSVNVADTLLNDENHPANQERKISPNIDVTSRPSQHQQENSNVNVHPPPLAKVGLNNFKNSKDEKASESIVINTHHHSHHQQHQQHQHQPHQHQQHPQQQHQQQQPPNPSRFVPSHSHANVNQNQNPTIVDTSRTNIVQNINTGNVESPNLNQQVPQPPPPQAIDQNQFQQPQQQPDLIKGDLHLPQGHLQAESELNIAPAEHPAPPPPPPPVDASSSFVPEGFLAESKVVQNSVVANNNINNLAKRRLLAERVGFVSVIMEIIPDEVELFFESFNISLHAIICTSIIAFFWCLMKIFIFFISSSKKVRELRDVICQIQRKIYYFDAEKEKMKQDYLQCRDESTSCKNNLSKIEKRKFQLEHENEKLKNEINLMKTENMNWKTQAESNPQITFKLSSVTGELEKFKQENSELKVKVKNLEEQIDSNLLQIKNQEKVAEEDKEEIDDLNQRLLVLNEEIEKINDLIFEYEQKLNLVQLENTNLKETQAKLNEEIKEMKDNLLSSQEKAEKFENEAKLLEKQLEMANETIKKLREELEQKNAEISSMQTLLNKLNKNLNNNKKEQKIRPVRSADLNGDIIDSMNGGNDCDDGIGSNLSNDSRENNADDGLCLQDMIQLQLRLTQLEQEKELFRKKYETLKQQMDEMVADMESTKKLNEQLREEIEIAKNERLKAITELEVLSKYYKEKELEYAKDIGVHKIKQEQQSEDVESMVSKLQSFQDENQMLKDLLKSLKKELEETDRRFKTQVNMLEKQAYENWIAARDAERKAEESRAEASALRLALSESLKSPPPPADHSFGPLGANYFDDTASSVSSIPDGMLNSSLPVIPPPPPPPPPFIFSQMFAPTMPPPPPAVASQQPPPPMVVPTSTFFYADKNETNHQINANNTQNNSTTYWSSSSAAQVPNSGGGSMVAGAAPMPPAQNSAIEGVVIYDENSSLIGGGVGGGHQQHPPPPMPPAQQHQHQHHPVIDSHNNSIYQNYPNVVAPSSSSYMMQHHQQQQQPPPHQHHHHLHQQQQPLPPPSLQESSPQSRPQSVHNQMV